MDRLNENFTAVTANYHLVKTCQSFLNTKYGKYDVVDYYLVNCLADGEFYFIFYREILLFFDGFFFQKVSQSLEMFSSP